MKEFGSSFKEMVTDQQILTHEIKKRKNDLIFWGTGLSFILFIYYFVSSKDFSFLLILSSMVQMLSVILLIWKVWSNKNSSGISLNTIICYIIILLARLSSTLFYNGYLPSDDAGDWFYQLTEIITLITLLALFYIISQVLSDTYNKENDLIHFKYLVIPSICLAFLAHTHLNKNFFTDVMWCFSMYLEAVAIYPQIFMFKEKKGHIETFTSHYVAFQGFSRLFTLIFWWYTYEELVEEGSEGYSLFQSYCGYLIIFSQFLQLIIMCEYYYLYFKSLIKGEKMTMEEML
jgi:ER lumen protein retaining receptor